jgi:hypothetical protein
LVDLRPIIAAIHYRENIAFEEEDVNLYHRLKSIEENDNLNEEGLRDLAKLKLIEVRPTMQFDTVIFTIENLRKKEITNSFELPLHVLDRIQDEIKMIKGLGSGFVNMAQTIDEYDF